MRGATATGLLAWRLLPSALLALGAAFLILDALSTLSGGLGLRHWAPAAAASAERLLPLAALGVLFAQLPPATRIPAILLFGFGALSGIAARDVFYLLMASVPGAAAHAFLTGPIAAVSTGLVLVLPQRWRSLPALLLIGPTGAVAAIGILLADPTLHTADYAPVAFVGAVWLMLGAGFAVRLVDRPWLSVASRVLGSWLIAIGLLFGTAQIAQKQTALVPPPFAEAPADGDNPGFSGWPGAGTQAGEVRP